MIQVKNGATIGMLILNQIDWKNRTACWGAKHLRHLKSGYRMIYIMQK